MTSVVRELRRCCLLEERLEVRASATLGNAEVCVRVNLKRTMTRRIRVVQSAPNARVGANNATQFCKKERELYVVDRTAGIDTYIHIKRFVLKGIYIKPLPNMPAVETAEIVRRSNHVPPEGCPPIELRRVRLAYRPHD